MLHAAGWLYGKVADLRNYLYDHDVFKRHDLGARTISIGNITTGGTGKTPLVAYVAEILAEAGEKVCILTRGYGRESSGRVLVSDCERVLVDAATGGDEPVELARKLIGKAVIVADAHRVAAAAWAKEKFGVTAFVLDDGFQHRRAKRDLDIVCIDATDPWGKMIPPAILREPLANLARADVIVLTRCNLADSIHPIIEKITGLNTHAPVFRAETRLLKLNPLDPANKTRERRTAAGAFAFCGLGNPRPFIAMLKQAGGDPTDVRIFADHTRYTQGDLDQIQSKAREQGCDALVTTGKDAVKLDGLKLEMPCFVAEIELVIDDAARFRDLVLST